jgi:hypothetical protein
MGDSRRRNKVQPLLMVTTDGGSKGKWMLRAKWSPVFRGRCSCVLDSWRIADCEKIPTFEISYRCGNLLIRHGRLHNASDAPEC